MAFAMAIFAKAQTVQTIQFSFSHQNKNLSLCDTSIQFLDTNQLQIEVLKFYVSKITFLKKGKVVLEENNSFHLIDASDKTTVLIAIQTVKNVAYDELRFSLGIDSVTNVSGAKGGDLDPTKGMYWAWQSGYLNFKIEGKSLLCKNRKNEFFYHLGGYQSPFNTLQTVSFSVKNKKKIILDLDANQFLNLIDISHQKNIMSPGEEAVRLSKLVTTCFKIKAN